MNGSASSHPPGPALRADIVDVYVFRVDDTQPDQPTTFLQLRRAATQSLAGTWQPVMGHMHHGEAAAQTALRELHEETGYSPANGLLGFWQLETPNIYFLHSHESIVISPCFAARVGTSHKPVLDADHDALRWVAADQAQASFIWPGQRTAIEQICRDLIPPHSPVESLLRIDPAAFSLS